MLANCLNANAKGYSQKLRLSEKNASMEKVFKEIGSQTGYRFVYTESLLNKAIKITISTTNTSFCFNGMLNVAALDTAISED